MPCSHFLTVSGLAFKHLANTGWLSFSFMELYWRLGRLIAKAAKLKKFSIHWLRHQSASMQDLVGIAEKNIQANYRHSKAETTRGYIHALDEHRHEAMQKLTLRIKTLR